MTSATSISERSSLRGPDHVFISFLTLQDEESQIVLATHKTGEHRILLKQPYLEGMLPQEYFVLMKAFEELEVKQLNTFMEVTSPEGVSKGNVEPITHYFNKRFYKFSQIDDIREDELPSQMEPSGRTLIAYEGIMLPTQSEVRFMQKCKFDFYTITNMAFMDLGLRIKYVPNLFGVVKANIADRHEKIPTEAFEALVQAAPTSFSGHIMEGQASPASHPPGKILEVSHSRQDILDAISAAKGFFAGEFPDLAVTVE